MRLYLRGRGNDLLGFEDVVRARLLDIDIFAALDAPNCHQGMPMVWRGNGKNVDILVIDYLTDVFVGFRRLHSIPGEHFQPFGKLSVVDVADRDNFRILHLFARTRPTAQMRSAAA